MSYRLAAFVGPLALAMVGCSVNVPNVDTNTFACKSNSDCTDGYRCSTAMRCVRSNSSSDPCTPNPCTNDAAKPLCKSDASGGYSCVDCSQMQCPDGMVCAKFANGNLSCQPTCTDATGVCSVLAGGDARCALVNTSQGSNLVCVPCGAVLPSGCPSGSSCQSITPGPSPFDASLKCIDLCTAASCKSGQVCVFTDAAETSVSCASSCSAVGSSCIDQGGSSGWCATIKAPNSAQPACITNIACSPTCSGGTQCGLPAVTYSSVAVASTAATCLCPTANGWYSLGLSGCGAGISASAKSVVSHAAVALPSSNGSVVVAWADNVNGIMVAQWNVATQQWPMINPSGGLQSYTDAGINMPSPLPPSSNPALTTDTSGTLRAGWTQLENTGKPYQIFWAEYAGSGSWVGEGYVAPSPGNWPSSTSDGISRLTAATASADFAAIAVSGTLLAAAWFQIGNTGTAQYWAGTTDSSHVWVDYPGPGGSAIAGDVSYGLAVPTPATAPKIAINPSTFEPWVVFAATSPPIDIYVRAPTGTTSGSPAWQNVSSNATPNPSSTLSGETGFLTPDIVMAGSMPVVAFVPLSGTSSLTGRLYVTCFNGASQPWLDCASGTTTLAPLSAAAQDPVLAADSLGGFYVAWEDDTYGYNINVSHFSGLAGTVTKTVTSLLPSALSSGAKPHIVFVSPRPDGTSGNAVCVSWMAVSGANNQLYMLCKNV
jgi:hypothetical protein